MFPRLKFAARILTPVPDQSIHPTPKKKKSQTQHHQKGYMKNEEQKKEEFRQNG